MRLIILLILFSCSHSPKPQGKVTIIKQWHPSPSTITTRVEAAKELPHYKNQREIYDYLVTLLKSKNLVLLVEGCEAPQAAEKALGSINGWSYSMLKSYAKRRDYDDVLTSVALKLKAKFPDKINAICADSIELIKKNQLALSNAKGFLGFYLKLNRVPTPSKEFKAFHKALEEVLKTSISDPITEARNQALYELERFKFYLSERNKVFLKAIKQNLKNDPILIVGGLHADEIMQQLTAERIETTMITPDDYPAESEQHISELTSALLPAK